MVMKQELLDHLASSGEEIVKNNPTLSRRETSEGMSVPEIVYKKEIFMPMPPPGAIPSDIAAQPAPGVEELTRRGSSVGVFTAQDRKRSSVKLDARQNSVLLRSLYESESPSPEDEFIIKELQLKSGPDELQVIDNPVLTEASPATLDAVTKLVGLDDDGRDDQGRFMTPAGSVPKPWMELSPATREEETAAMADLVAKTRKATASGGRQRHPSDASSMLEKKRALQKEPEGEAALPTPKLAYASSTRSPASALIKSMKETRANIRRVITGKPKPKVRKLTISGAPRKNPPPGYPPQRSDFSSTADAGVSTNMDTGSTTIDSKASVRQSAPARLPEQKKRIFGFMTPRSSKKEGTPRLTADPYADTPGRVPLSSPAMSSDAEEIDALNREGFEMPPASSAPAPTSTVELVSKPTVITTSTSNTGDDGVAVGEWHEAIDSLTEKLTARSEARSEARRAATIGFGDAEVETKPVLQDETLLPSEQQLSADLPPMLPDSKRESNSDTTPTEKQLDAAADVLQNAARAAGPAVEPAGKVPDSPATSTSSKGSPASALSRRARFQAIIGRFSGGNRSPPRIPRGPTDTRTSDDAISAVDPSGSNVRKVGKLSADLTTESTVTGASGEDLISSHIGNRQDTFRGTGWIPKPRTNKSPIIWGFRGNKLPERRGGPPESSFHTGVKPGNK